MRSEELEWCSMRGFDEVEPSSDAEDEESPDALEPSEGISSLEGSRVEDGREGDARRDAVGVSESGVEASEGSENGRFGGGFGRSRRGVGIVHRSPPARKPQWQK